MANLKISALPLGATPLDGTEIVPIVQSGSTKKVSISNITVGRAVSGVSFAVTGSTAPVNGVYQSATNQTSLSANSVRALTTTEQGSVLLRSATTPFLYSLTSNARGLLNIGAADVGKVLSGVVNGVASSGTADFDVSYFANGFLQIGNEYDANGNIRTHTTYSVFSRGGNNATFTQIATANGGTGAASFSVAWTGTSTIRVTNTSAYTTNVYLSYFGQ
jgi:hypothetical protein